MKVSSKLLTAMLITATLTAGTGCKVIKQKLEDKKTQTEQDSDNRHSDEPCPACGMG